MSLGHRTAPSPWTSYAGRNPCAEIDNRETTIASFEPFVDFNQPSFTVSVAAHPLVGVNNACTRYPFQTGRILGLRANDRSEAQNLHNESPAHLPRCSIAVQGGSRGRGRARAQLSRNR
jgi:hypothetical protein